MKELLRVEKSKDEEKQIEHLKDIVSIEYLDIHIPDSTGKNKIYPGFYVVYNQTKHMFLMTFNSHFEEFVRRLKEVYLEEKDNIVSNGIMGPKGIHISPVAKEVLLSGDLEKVSSFYRKYQNEEGYDDSLLFEEDEFHSIFPIFEYHLREILKRFDIHMEDVQLSTGVNGSYYLRTKIHNVPEILPLHFKRDDQRYSLDVGNVLPNAIPIHMEVTFKNQAISVYSSIPEYEYSDFFTYSVEKGIPYYERDIYWKDENVFYHKEHLPMMEGVPDNILPKEEDTKWYPTAWGGYIGIAGKGQMLSDVDYLEDSYYYYVHRSDQHYYELEQDAKKYFKLQSDGSHFVPVVFDTMNQKTIGIHNGQTIIFENSFYDPCKTGFYRDHLNKKHFYSISFATTWKDAANSIFINRDNGVEDKADLLDSKLLEKRLNENGNIQ